MTTLNRPGVTDVTLRLRRIVGTALFAACFVSVSANADNNIPPDDDPSRFGDLVTGPLPDDHFEANEGTFEGGMTGSVLDAGKSNVLTKEEQREDCVFNIPANGAPSPMYEAVPFTQKMLRFEEFGTKKLKIKN